MQKTIFCTLKSKKIISFLLLLAPNSFLFFYLFNKKDNALFPVGCPNHLKVTWCLGT